MKTRAALAHLVEHIIRNDGVACSSQASGTIHPKVKLNHKNFFFPRAMAFEI